MKKFFHSFLRAVYLKVADFVFRFYQKYYYADCRKRLKNSNFTIISPNCYAGLMYHRLGMQFLSPTINLYFPIRSQYLKFVKNLEYYLSQELKFFDDPVYPQYPVAMLDDAKIVFNHYKNAEEAKTAWDKRKKRVNYDNLFVIFDDINEMTYDDLVEFNNTKSKGKVIFTAKEYDDLPNAVLISKYKKSGKLKHYLMERNHFTGKNPADKDFDFVDWLNGGTGKKNKA